MSKRKIVFFNLSLRNYCYDDEEEERYATHGSCAFMVPRTGKGYDMYYVNHHGEAMDGTLDYERVLTRTRNQKYSFKQPVDFIVLDQIVKYMNTRLRRPFTMTLQPVTTFTVLTRYLDVHHFCFIFPIIIYYSLGKYFNDSKMVNVGGAFKNLTSLFHKLSRKEI